MRYRNFSIQLVTRQVPGSFETTLIISHAISLEYITLFLQFIVATITPLLFYSTTLIMLRQASFSSSENVPLVSDISMFFVFLNEYASNIDVWMDVKSLSSNTVKT